MPVMVLYKAKTIPNKVTEDISLKTAELTKQLLNSKIEVRVIEPVFSYNANEIHLEMRYRDFHEWDEKQLQDYHKKIMAGIAEVLKKHFISCSFSFYILPSSPPLSIWEQDKV